MTDPPVVRAMRQFKRDIVAYEYQQGLLLARRWREVERALQASLDAIADAIAAGEVPRGLWKWERLQALLVQVQREMVQYAAYTTSLTIEGQSEMARRALTHAQTAIQLAMYPRVDLAFNVLNADAVMTMIGLTADGSPVADLIQRRMVRAANGAPLPGVTERITNTLTQAVAEGWNPVKTARLLQGDIADGYQRALLITRTEQLRVYRETTRQQYEASGIVIGQQRVASHDERVCLGCLADEGTVYPLDEPIPDHPAGRCVGIPLLRDVPAPEWDAGETWLEQQSEAFQRSVMGGYYEGWQAGDFAFSDLTRTRHDPVWGDSVQPTPLRELRQ